jgi:multiple sugar transport system permease protein
VSPARAVSRGILYLVLTVGALLCLLPIFWLVRSSLMTLVEVFKFPPLLWATHSRWDNFAAAMSTSPFFLYFRNTLIVVIPTVLATLVTSTLSAYGFARFRFPLRGFWFAMVLGAIILPPAVVLIPQFIMWSRVHLVNTFFPLIVPFWFGGGAFNVFLLRQFFLTIPRDFDDAARIDGANYFRILSRILLPFIQPALIAVGLFQFFFQWNDFFGPLIYLNSPSTYTLALGLQHFIGSYSTQWNILMAATVIVIVPPIVVFFVGQRYFVEGVTLTGIKM